MSKDGQSTKCRRNFAENYNRLSTAHERYRRQTDRRTATANSECLREFTFAKNRYGVDADCGALDGVHIGAT